MNWFYLGFDVWSQHPSRLYSHSGYDNSEIEIVPEAKGEVRT
jgi:hypothetical protein